MPQVFVFAFLVVILSALLTTPVLLYVLGLAAHGWRWQHGALFRWEYLQAYGLACFSVAWGAAS